MEGTGGSAPGIQDPRLLQILPPSTQVHRGIGKGRGRTEVSEAFKTSRKAEMHQDINILLFLPMQNRLQNVVYLWVQVKIKEKEIIYLSQNVTTPGIYPE